MIFEKILLKSNIDKMIKNKNKKKRKGCAFFRFFLVQELACSGLIGTNCGPETNELCTLVLEGSQRKQICRPCLYSVFHQFREAKSANGGSILSSSQFLILPQLPQKIKLASKEVKIDSKIIISLPTI